MLNPACLRHVHVSGFQHEVSRLTALSVANPIPSPFNCDSVQTMICETLAGGEIECAHWMLDAAEQIKAFANLRIRHLKNRESGTTTLLNVWALKWPAVA